MELVHLMPELHQRIADEVHTVSTALNYFSTCHELRKVLRVCDTCYHEPVKHFVAQRILSNNTLRRSLHQIHFDSLRNGYDERCPLYSHLTEYYETNSASVLSLLLDIYAEDTESVKKTLSDNIININFMMAHEEYHRGSCIETAISLGECEIVEALCTYNNTTIDYIDCNHNTYIFQVLLESQDSHIMQRIVGLLIKNTERQSCVPTIDVFDMVLKYYNNHHENEFCDWSLKKLYKQVFAQLCASSWLTQHVSEELYKKYQ
jgi:hypothetical protein